MSEIAVLSPSRMPIAPSIAKEFNLGPTEWRVLVDQIFPSAKTVEAVLMALSYCRARNLDIYKRPVHVVPMWSSAKDAMVETVWPGIAEIRTTAARTGEYAGIDAAEFGPDVEREFVGTDRRTKEKIARTVTFPSWGSVVVWRVIKGEKRAFHTKIYWLETYATMGSKSEVPNDMWCKRPRGQFDKCLEAAALRKAFPEEVGSMYAAEEMEGKTIEGAISASAIVPERQIAPPPPSEAEGDQTPAHEGDQLAAEPFNFDGLELALAGAHTEDELDKVFDEFEVQVSLVDDQDGLDRAFAMRESRRRVLAASAAITTGFGTGK